MNYDENYKIYCDDECKRINKLIDEAEGLGDNEEIIRIMQEEVYALMFTQNQYIRRVYDIIQNFYESLEPEDKEKARTTISNYLTNLRGSINRTNNRLENWDRIVDRILREGLKGKKLEEVLE